MELKGPKENPSPPQSSSVSPVCPPRDRNYVDPTLHSPIPPTTVPSSTWAGPLLSRLTGSTDALVKRSQTSDSCSLSTCYPLQHHMILSGTEDAKKCPRMLERL